LPKTSETSGSVLWRGKPWILPNVVTRTILIIVVAIVISWFELTYDVRGRLASNLPISNVQIVLLIDLVIFLVWVLSLAQLLLMRASNTYILRNDSLEIRSGILTSKSFVISPSGFSDLEVIRSISNRIVNSGNIIIRTQSETQSDLTMQKVRNPMSVASQIRGVMARPIVRIEGKE
jgi:membrane protein YdbS with pleckstrin-like domain